MALLNIKQNSKEQFTVSRTSINEFRRYGMHRLENNFTLQTAQLNCESTMDLRKSNCKLQALINDENAK